MGSTYAEGRNNELAPLSKAHNYYRWILSHWRPYLRGRVLEVGAGLGTFSAYLLQEAVECVSLIEPASDLINDLRQRFRGDPRVEAFHGVLEEWAVDIGGPVDCIVSVNVLEHIPDDSLIIATARRVLQPGGSLLLFVPAFQCLSGPMDAEFNHLRRYTKAGLSRLLREGGFVVQDIRYMNWLGTFTWFFANHILRRRTLTPAMVAMADRTLIPLTARLERFLRPPFGQSVMAIAKRPEHDGDEV